MVPRFGCVSGWFSALYGGCETRCDRERRATHTLFAGGLSSSSSTRQAKEHRARARKGRQSKRRLPDFCLPRSRVITPPCRRPSLPCPAASSAVHHRVSSRFLISFPSATIWITTHFTVRHRIPPPLLSLSSVLLVGRSPGPISFWVCATTHVNREVFVPLMMISGRRNVR